MTAEDTTECHLTDLDGKVRITVIGMAAIIGLLVTGLLWSCCKTPERKERMKETMYTVVSKFG
jgi:hypothetical protein